MFQNSIQELYGDYGLAVVQSNLGIKYLNPITRTVLIRVSRGAHLIVINALAMIKKIQQTPVMFWTLHVAGSIRLCQKFLVRHNQQQLRLLLRNCPANEKKELEEKLASTGVSLDDLPDLPLEYK